ncbi:hypothetical protein Mapa_002089 [Marchantia paleacea]|nr:hypothetical protein Mapa_002089 [Marchantia paleacea]
MSSGRPRRTTTILQTIIESLKAHKCCGEQIYEFRQKRTKGATGVECGQSSNRAYSLAAASPTCKKICISSAVKFWLLQCNATVCGYMCPSPPQCLCVFLRPTMASKGSRTCGILWKLQVSALRVWVPGG